MAHQCLFIWLFGLLLVRIGVLENLPPLLIGTVLCLVAARTATLAARTSYADYVKLRTRFGSHSPGPRATSDDVVWQVRAPVVRLSAMPTDATPKENSTVEMSEVQRSSQQHETTSSMTGTNGHGPKHEDPDDAVIDVGDIYPNDSGGSKSARSSVTANPLR